MTVFAVAVAVILGAVLGSALFGQRRSGAKGIEEWAIGGRHFGTLIFWFLNAGEIYTTFAVLGISGFAWAFGAPAFLALSSVSLSAIIGYWLTPKIWAAGSEGRLVSQADFFDTYYKSRILTLMVAVAGIAALVVYVQIQITALGLVIRLIPGVTVPPILAETASAVIMLMFVYAAGLRSAAFAAGVKDVLMLGLVVGLGVGVGHRVGASSVLDVFRLVQMNHPGIGAFPGLKPEAHYTTTWLMTSSMNVALGTWILPHMFQLCYSATGVTTIRRNAIWQPLYSLSYFFIILLGFAALLSNVKPPGGNLNAALIQLVADRFSPWAFGLFAGTICLLALVPGSVLLLTAGTIFTRNIVQPLDLRLKESKVLLISRASMIGFAALAVWLTVGANRSLVSVGLSAYAAIGMLAPGIYLAFLRRRLPPIAIICGMVAGYASLLVPGVTRFWERYAPEWDKGLIALILNVIVVGVVAMASRVLTDATSARPLRLG
jgi:solute:Na+ symporter, SSS family